MSRDCRFGIGAGEAACVVRVAGGKLEVHATRSDIVAATDGGKSNTLAAGRIMGGTGKFRSIRGNIRVASSPDPGSGLMRSAFDIDYWLDK